MKSMKLSAIVLGLAAAGAIAQTAPAAAAAEPAPAPAAEAPKAEAAPAAQPAAEAAPAAQPAEEAAPAAQPAAPAAEQTAEAPKAEPQPAAEPAPAPEAAKVEEAKAEPAATEAQPAEKKEEATESAGLSITERLNISKADAEPEAKKAAEFKVSGAAEFDAYGYWKNDDNKDLYHDYWSTVDVDFEVKLNENWSAQVEIEADGFGTDPHAYYNGAFVQYQNGEDLTVKFGDLTFAEGAFNYYGYDDPADNAAGMTEHDIRGLELDLFGLQIGLGFGRGGNDLAIYNCDEEGSCQGKGYDAHVAYQFNYAGQSLRPYAHYKSYAEDDKDELHAGLEAALELGPFGIHAVYGFQTDNVSEDYPKATHTFLAEPTFKVSNVNVKGGFFYALLEDNLDEATIHGTEIPEYMFAYGEADLKLTDAVTIGLLGELHTNSLDDDTDLGTLNFGTRIYFSPVDGLDVTGFAMAILPMGDDWEDENHANWVSTKDYGEDLNLYFGVETVFSF